MHNILKYRPQIFIVTITFLLVVCLVYFGSEKNFEQVKNFNELDALIIQVQKQASVRIPEYKLVLNKKSNSYWISPDGYGVFVPNYAALILPTGSNSLDSVLRDSRVRGLSDDTARIFKHAGFTIDSVNTSTSTDDLKFDWFSTAFKSSDGKFLCIIYVDGGNPEWSLQCVTEKDFNTSYEAQMPFIIALGKPKGVIVSPFQNGNYASVGVTPGNGGYFAIMRKVDGEWTVIYRGQRRPSCKLMIQNSVPLSIYKECV